MKHFFIIFLAFSFFSAYGQNEIWFYDGTIKSAEKLQTDSNTVFYTNSKGKVKYESKADVFAIVSGKDTTYLYQRSDTAQMSVYQLKNYIQGKNDGKKYKNNLIFAGAVITGLATPFLFASAGLSTAFAPLVPLIYDIIVGSIKAKKHNYNPDLQNNNEYVQGYKQEVQKRRTLIAILGSVIGLAIGLLIAYFVFEYGK